MSAKKNVAELTAKALLKQDVEEMERGVVRKRMKDLVEDLLLYYNDALKEMQIGDLEDLAISFTSMMVKEMEYRISCLKWQREVMQNVQVPLYLMPKRKMVVQASVLVPWARYTYGTLRDNCEISSRTKKEVEEKKLLLSGFGSFIRQWFYVYLPEKAHIPTEWRSLPQDEIERRGLQYEKFPVGGALAYRNAAIKTDNEDGTEMHQTSKGNDENPKKKISNQQLREAFPALDHESSSDEEN